MATGDNPFPDDLGLLPTGTAQALHRAVRAGVHAAGGPLALFQESCSRLVGGRTVRSPDHLGGPAQRGVLVRGAGVQEGGGRRFPKHDTVALSIARELRNLPGDLPSTTRVCFSQLAMWGAQDLHPDSKCGLRCGGALIVSRPAAAVTAPRTASRTLKFATRPSDQTFSLRFSDNEMYFATSRVRGCEFALLKRERDRVRTAKKKAERESAASGSGAGEGSGGASGSGGGEGSADDLLRDLYRELFGEPAWVHKGDPQEQCPQLAYFFDVWQEDDDTVQEDDDTVQEDDTVEEDVLSDGEKEAADAAGVPHGAALQVLARGRRQRCQDRGLVTFLRQDPDLDPVDPKDLDPVDLHLDFEQVKLLALAKDKDSEEKQLRQQQREREKEERKQQREREKELHIERKLTELRALAENDLDAKTRVRKLAKLATMATEVKQKLQELLVSIPDASLQAALRSDMMSPSTLGYLCDKYSVDKSGLRSKGVFEKLKSVYNSL